MIMKQVRQIRRGDVFYADLGEVVGSEQGGIRPVVVLSNDIGNKYGTTIITAPITRASKRGLPTHVEIKMPFVDGTIMMEQLRTLSIARLQKKIGHLMDMGSIEQAILATFQMEDGALL